MVVKNISLSGIGFETLTGHQLKVGDEVTVKFALDDVSHSVIKKKVIVRVVKDKYLGCEFKEPAQYDKALGFYLIT